MVRIDLMFKIIICMVFTNVLSMIDPCYPTGDSCTKEDDCPKAFKCIDDSPDPDNSDEMNGICVGNKKIEGCGMGEGGNESIRFHLIKTVKKWNSNKVSSKWVALILEY